MKKVYCMKDKDPKLSVKYDWIKKSGRYVISRYFNQYKY